MRIATYNIRHGAPAGAWADHRGLAATCGQLDVDLLAVQEIDRFVVRSRWADQVRVIARATGLYPTFVSARSFGPGGRYGIAVFSRDAPGAVEFVRLPAFGREQRMAIIGRVACDGEQVTVAVTHLHNQRRVATRQLKIVLDRLEARPGPHLVMGDLNLGPDDVERVLSDRRYVSDGGGPTFPAVRPTRKIDWIAGRGVTLTATTVVDSTQSDHRPLVSVLSVATSGPN